MSQIQRPHTLTVSEHSLVERGDSREHGDLVLPSTKCFAILTCMDARIDASKLAGRRGSEAHVIRNAGARANDDAIRSLVLSHELLGTREWYVVQHSHCGMALLNDEIIRDLLEVPHPHATRGDIAAMRQSHAKTAKLKLSDQEHSVAADVARIRNHPLVPLEIPIFGYIYHAETGRFVEVQRATELGTCAVQPPFAAL
jgi:carbonic anhydrase